MNAARSSMELVPVMPAEVQVVGLAHPELPDNAREIARAIGRQTKGAGRAIWRGLVAAWRWLDEQSRRSAEIHNRMQTVLDERYRHNPYFLRGFH